MLQFLIHEGLSYNLVYNAGTGQHFTHAPLYGDKKHTWCTLLSEEESIYPSYGCLCFNNVMHM